MTAFEFFIVVVTSVSTGILTAELSDYFRRPKCDVCLKRRREDQLTWDEDDVRWCHRCIKGWEKKNRMHWETGRPWELDELD